MKSFSFSPEYFQKFPKLKTSIRLAVLCSICLALSVATSLSGKATSSSTYEWFIFLGFLYAALLFHFSRKPSRGYVDELSFFYLLGTRLGLNKVSFMASIFFAILAFFFIAYGISKLFHSPNIALSIKSRENFTVAYEHDIESDRAKIRRKNAESLAVLYRPGTNMMNIFGKCKNRDCVMPDRQAFEAFKPYSVFADDYDTKICMHLYANTNWGSQLKWRALQEQAIPPKFLLTDSDVKLHAKSGIDCNLSTAYIEGIHENHRNSIRPLLYLQTALFIFLYSIYLFTVFITSPWRRFLRKSRPSAA